MNYICDCCGEEITKHIVQYSGGICSFFAAKRVVEQYRKRKRNIIILRYINRRRGLIQIYRRNSKIFRL